MLANGERDLFHSPDIRNKNLWVCSHSCSVCFKPSSPLNACGLLAEVIYYLISGNGALCLLRSSFFLPFRIYHSLNDGSLHLALPHMSSCWDVCECVFVCFEERATAHTHWKPATPSPRPATPKTIPSILSHLRKSWCSHNSSLNEWCSRLCAAVSRAAAAAHVFTILSADGWSCAGGGKWRCGGIEYRSVSDRCVVSSFVKSARCVSWARGSGGGGER